MISVYSVLYTLVLFSELSSHTVTVAIPATKAEDGVIEQDDLSLLLGDEPMTETAEVPHVYRRSLVLDNNMRDEDGSPRIVFGSDMRLNGHSRDRNPGFPWSLALLPDQSLSHTPADNRVKIDRRNTDIDMLRCMIGRVYRPCWDV